MLSTFKLMRYLIYIYLDLDKPGIFSYSTSHSIYQFDYEPIYIGKGALGRMESHEHNASNQKLKEFIESKNYETKIIKENLASHYAYKLESELIYLIGRIDLQTGPLLNESSGVYLTDAKTHEEIGPLHLEFNKMIHILKVLNNQKSIKNSATLLGISERTIYRYLKGYHIIKDKQSKEFYQEV